MDKQTIERIGVAVNLQQAIELFNGVRGGQIFCIRGYENSKGEIADHYLQFGINYGNLKKRLYKAILDIRDNQPTFTVEVTGPAGKVARTPVPAALADNEMTETLDRSYEVIIKGDPVKIVELAINELCSELDPNRQSKRSQSQTDAYDKEAKGFYSNDDDQGNERLYIRVVQKTEPTGKKKTASNTGHENKLPR